MIVLGPYFLSPQINDPDIPFEFNHLVWPRRSFAKFGSSFLFLFGFAPCWGTFFRCGCTSWCGTSSVTWLWASGVPWLGASTARNELRCAARNRMRNLKNSISLNLTNKSREQNYDRCNMYVYAYVRLSINIFGPWVPWHWGETAPPWAAPCNFLSVIFWDERNIIPKQTVSLLQSNQIPKRNFYFRNE